MIMTGPVEYDGQELYINKVLISLYISVFIEESSMKPNMNYQNTCIG